MKTGKSAHYDSAASVEHHARSAAKASASARPRRIAAWRVLVLVLLLGSWELASGPVVSPVFASSPSRLLARLVELFGTGVIWRDIGTTYLEVGYGYLLAAVVGIAGGVLLGRARFAADVLEPFIMALYSIPKIALAPLFILWLGIGMQSKIGISFLSALFLIFYGTYAGIRNLDEGMVTTARLLGATRGDVIRRVVVPMSAPFILTGLRTGLPFAVIGAVVGEFMASNSGLGFYILSSSAMLDATGGFAGISVLVAGVLGANWALQAAERRLVRWRPVDSGTVAG